MSSSAHAEWEWNFDWRTDLESPFTTDAKWILIYGSGLTVTTLALHQSVFGPWEQRTVEEKPLGSTSQYGDALGQLLPNGVYVLGALASKWWGSDLAYYRAWLMFEASAYAAAVTTVMKYAIAEPRPYDASVRNSFPSGHATTAFAFAGVVAAEHGWWWGVPSMAMATFVAYSRINDDQHRVHDVVAGATVGLSCAYGIYYAHQGERKKALGEKLTLVPMYVPGGEGLAAIWTY